MAKNIFIIGKNKFIRLCHPTWPVVVGWPGNLQTGLKCLIILILTKLYYNEKTTNTFYIYLHLSSLA